MKLLLDMHNHTISSGHAYSTVIEIATVASEKGLKYVGITDHGPKMPGGASYLSYRKSEGYTKGHKRSRSIKRG